MNILPNSSGRPPFDGSYTNLYSNRYAGGLPAPNVFGTPNQIDVAVGVSSVLLSTPQNIDTSSEFQTLRLLDSSQGSANQFFGTNAGVNVTGSMNIVIGSNAGDSIAGADGCIAIGAGSLSTAAADMTTDNQSRHIAIGLSSGAFLGGTSASDICIGYFAGQNLTTGSNNIMVGECTQGSSATVANEIVISTNGTVTVPIGGKGTNTAFIDARNGLFFTLPAVAQFPIILGNATIGSSASYVPFFSYSTTDTNSALYFNRGLTLTTTSVLNGGYWQFQQLGLYKINVRMNFLGAFNTLSTPPYINGVDVLVVSASSPGGAVVQNVGQVTMFTTNLAVAQPIIVSFSGVIRVTDLSLVYGISTFPSIAASTLDAGNNSVLIEYLGSV